MISASEVLTIGIPTYNRATKLRRLLDALVGQVEAARGRVGILVSDNCSTDDTPATVAIWASDHPNVHVEFVRQPENVGGGRNLRFLYEQAPSDFVWFFGDDDLPIPGALERILYAIDTYGPDVIVGAFEQPPGTLLPILPAGSPDQPSAAPATAARSICAATKLTSYVLRTGILPSRQPGDAIDSIRFGFHCCILAFAILDARNGGKTSLLADAIAVSDYDFAYFRGPVEDWYAYKTLLDHPFVARHAPDLSAHSDRASYAVLIDILWAWRKGLYEIDESVVDGYWAELRSVRLRWRDAFHIPIQLLLHLVLKVEPVYLPRIISQTRRRLTGRLPGT